MTVYELIQELCKHEPDKEVIFYLNAEFYVGEEKINYEVDIDIADIRKDKKHLQIEFTN